MSQRTPPNPGRRRFFGELFSTLAQEAGHITREARRAALEIENALAESQEPPPALVETPIHDDLDDSELAERLDGIDAELAELEGQVQRLIEAAAQPHALANEDRALLRRVAEALAERHTELAATPSETTAATGIKAEDNAEDDERAVLRRRRAALREKVWTLITALLGVRLFDALYETFVSDELVPWAKEQWQGIFARAEAAGVIEESPLPSPTAESPHPAATATPEPETPTPPRRTQRRGRILVPEMVPVGAGWFWMGSDKRIDRNAHDDELPQHRVYLSAYRIGKYPVTNEEYAAFLTATGHQQPYAWDDNRSKLDHPVVHVSWDDAVAYCRWLSEATGDTYRLPSEAQWEKAARGNDGRIYPWGNQPPDARRCNFNGNVGDTTTVGSYPAGVSPYGCYDMAGNVWEWVNDWYDSGYYADAPVRNPQGPASGTSRVLRGGSWNGNPSGVRAADRGRNVPDDRNNDVGFRLVAPASERCSLKTLCSVDDGFAEPTGLTRRVAQTVSLRCNCQPKQTQTRGRLRMAVSLTAEVYQDDMAVTLANALAAANRRAVEMGVDVADSLLTISQRIGHDGMIWRVNYGPREYINQRGGDLIVDVAAHSGEVEQVLYGQ